MKVLLDECVDARLAREIIGHEVRTVPRMGWSGLDDGAVLRLAETASFEAGVTIDQNLEFQQNLATFRLAIVVLSGGTRLADLKRLVPALLATLPSAKVGTATRVGP